MLNGDGLRVVLWLSGCNHKCKGCQNPQTWDINSGIPFDKVAEEELFQELSKDYISGITFTGGDPLHENNLDEVLKLVNQIRLLLPEKTIWLYSGYTWEEIMNYELISDLLEDDDLFVKHAKIDMDMLERQKVIKSVDVFVDGKYIDSQRDITLKWCGSKNQRVIDIQKSLEKGEVVLWDTL